MPIKPGVIAICEHCNKMEVRVGQEMRATVDLHTKGWGLRTIAGHEKVLCPSCTKAADRRSRLLKRLELGEQA